MLNLLFGWWSFLAGVLSGALLGLAFHRATFLGGYDSYPRRLIRLGHISFFGLGFVNVLFGLSLPSLQLAPHEAHAAGVALIIGNISMPLACGLTAWRAQLKPVFVVPVGTMLYGVLAAAIGATRAHFQRGG